MVKKRTGIPKAISEQVLKEFRYKCAICGRHEPHLHHIDEDPSNNTIENLLPLCPNCHLQDSHDPTAPVDSCKIKLFRRIKDPLIFDPRFHPLWRRLRFLRENASDRAESWQWSCNNLYEFVKALKMGQYYSNSIMGVLRVPHEHYIVHQHKQGNRISKENIDPNELRIFCATVIEDMCVEMLRYQEWQINLQRTP
jgi:hypothetical protein